MDQMTQQNAAMAEEASAASQSLRQGGEQLSALVGEFMLGDRPSAILSSELMKVAPHAFKSPDREKRLPRPAPISPTTVSSFPVKGAAAVAANARTSWDEF